MNFWEGCFEISLDKVRFPYWWLESPGGFGAVVGGAGGCVLGARRRGIDRCAVAALQLHVAGLGMALLPEAIDLTADLLIAVCGDRLQMLSFYGADQ